MRDVTGEHLRHARSSKAASAELGTLPVGGFRGRLRWHVSQLPSERGRKASGRGSLGSRSHYLRAGGISKSTGRKRVGPAEDAEGQELSLGVAGGRS